MTDTARSFGIAGSEGVAAVWAVVRRAAGWLPRVFRARALMHQLASLDARELRDIGLTPADLRDASALPLAADPSLALWRRAEERRRWR